MGKIYQYLQKKLVRSSLDATFSEEKYAGFPDEFGNLHENAFNTIHMLIKKHSEEILNARGLEYS